MSEKFRYAPGKPGFGKKGIDGSAGSQGLSMYFTDYDPNTQILEINTAIANNYSLWSYSGSPILLPSGRNYVSGDIFIDSNGKIYEINAENNTFEYKFCELNTAGYFIPAEVSTDLYGYERYHNNNTARKYLIDSIYTSGSVTYYNIPTNIYNILPRNFARIEYSNINQNNYNPFTLFSSADPEAANNEKAIALVRSINDNTFRLGNLDDNGNIRDVNLTFDVSSLRHTKDSKSIFNINTAEGAILTNYEINANALFDNTFNMSPYSFKAGYSPTDVSIEWDLTNFTADSNIVADLYVFLETSTYGTISLVQDSSKYIPLIFHDVSTTGILHITDISSNTTYKYYMNFHKNGWERRSAVKTVTTAEIPNILVSPSELYLEMSAINNVGFCVSSNINWSAQIYGSEKTCIIKLIH
jgi:hypothetical protein